jgi:hypothetical protein
VACLVILFQIVGDLFHDRSLGGPAKALWMLVLIVFPRLGALVYLLVRGRGMAERAQAMVSETETATDDYIRAVTDTSPVQEIATAQELPSAGTVTSGELARLKARALASA